VCVYICIQYVHIYIYVHIYTHIHIHTDWNLLKAYVRIYTNVCISICNYVYIFIHNPGWNSLMVCLNTRSNSIKRFPHSFTIALYNPSIYLCVFTYFLVDGHHYSSHADWNTYIDTHVYIYVREYIYVYTDTRIYIYTYVYIYMHVCLYVYVYVYGSTEIPRIESVKCVCEYGHFF